MKASTLLSAIFIILAFSELTPAADPTFEEIAPDLFLLRDTCNVYVLRDQDRAVAIDFGSHDWTKKLDSIGVHHLDYIFLTHHHRDQCEGLLDYKGDARIFAPAGESAFLTPDGVKRYWEQRTGRPISYATSFSVPPRGIEKIQFGMGYGSDIFWRQNRIRFLPTPGHTKSATTVIITWHGKNVFFCGDAVYDQGKIWEPYHLEWDHWTGDGALQAWSGLQRLGWCQIDLLCPSHGPVIREKANDQVALASERLMAFIRAKGSIAERERDDYIPLEPIPDVNARKVSPHLFQVGGNGLVILSDTGEALYIDPYRSDLPAIEAALPLIGVKKLAASIASHYHYDHSDAYPDLKAKYGAEIWMHPWIAQMLQHSDTEDRPFLPGAPIQPDRLLPESGKFTWNEYEFEIWPMPGQTWWHAAFMTTIDGQKVFFSGDTFQSPSRWNGTGGFCAFNNSRFEGFRQSAQLVLKTKPDIIANGHNVIYRFHPSHYEKILRWADSAEKGVLDLCPSGDLEKDYYFSQKLEKP